MKFSRFVHLHNHTDFSLLDGACKIERMVDLASQYQMPALAITDHGNMCGVVKFYKQCIKKGIKPVIGMEAYSARESRFAKKGTRRGGDSFFHLTLLARDMDGYRNLLQLATKGYTEGFYYKPRIDRELLHEFGGGLIALSGCLKGRIPNMLLNDDFDSAMSLAGEYEDIFGKGNFYLEVMDHGIPEEVEVKEKLVKLSERTGIPLVATNDCHYLHRQDARAHDALLCIQTGKTLKMENRMRFSTDQVYFKSPQEMEILFSTMPEAISNTLEIAERCNVRLESSSFHLPLFEIPDDFEGSAAEYLRHLVMARLPVRFPDPSEEVMARIDHEIGIITRMGFSGYFLIVQDLIRKAGEMGVPVGPGRGSAAASIVSYILGITDVNPLEFNLLFERFLNPERVSMPDIDIDFCFEKRGMVIDYVIEKYGRENVCQIITFGKIKARAAIRDVGRVMEIPYAEVDRIAKLIPAELGITIERALKGAPELKDLVESNEEYGELIEIAKRLEGLCRHASIHAAGVVITPGKLVEYTPLYRSSNDEITTQFDMKSLEEMGILKMDFLGLRTLTVIQNCLETLRGKGIDLDISTIRMDDPETFRLLREARTVGVFQLESRGMRDLLLKIKADRFEDVIAANALFRPGPMERVDEFISRKHGKNEIRYDHPLLEKCLSDTYGVMIYQEQVMQAANLLAGFSMGQADMLRKAMGKKIVDIMDKHRKEFTDGAAARDVDRKIAEDVFDQMTKFAGYGFNKAHATAYSVISFRTAYLKAHHPVEFMAANLTSELNDTSRITVLINECRNMGIEVLPPDIDESVAGFSADGGKIRFGLGAIKNVGLGAIESIMEARAEKGPFGTLTHFCRSVDLRLVNKRVVESLILSGAMDGLEGSRAQLFAVADGVISRAQRYQQEANSRQTSLFGGENGEESVLSGLGVTLPEIDEWPLVEKLNKERELLGFYVSGHPLLRFESEILALTTCGLAEIKELNDNEDCLVGGIVVSIKEIVTRKGKSMAFLTLEDFTGDIEIIIFSDVYEEYKGLLVQDAMLLVKGTVSSSGEKEGVKIKAYGVFALKTVFETEASKFTSLEMTGKTSSFDDENLRELAKILSTHRGKCPVFLRLETADNSMLRLQLKRTSVMPDGKLIGILRTHFPGMRVHVKLNHNRPARPRQGKGWYGKAQ